LSRANRSFSKYICNPSGRASSSLDKQCIKFVFVFAFKLEAAPIKFPCQSRLSLPELRASSFLG